MDGNTLRIGSGGVIFTANGGLTGGQITAGTAGDTAGTLYLHNQYTGGTLHLAKSDDAIAVAGDVFIGVNPALALGTQAILSLGGSNQYALLVGVLALGLALRNRRRRR